MARSLSVLGRRWGWLSLVVLVLAVVLLTRAWHGRAARAAAADAGALPAVAVARVEREDLFRQISIPAEFRPYAEVELHAKVSGYVKEMKVDIGDRVQPGQLLAVLEVPELGDELDHARASQRRAQADYRDAHLAYTRLVAANKQHPNLIAEQDLDTAEAHDATAEGALAAARADADKYQTLVAYTRITAPFGGVITKRYADPGALIQAGTASNTQSMPLVRLSDNTLLRLDFPVSVDYVRGIRLDAPVAVSVGSLGGRTYTGRIKRFSDQVDDSTRTMVVEMEVPNPSLELVPGMYATVTLKTEERPHALAIPTEAVPPGGKSVLVVDATGRVAERRVTLGLETPARYEVLSGLHEGELVMIGNPGQVPLGDRVEPRLTAPLARE
ncbi:MAG TPA: efflux RND transporter periplasmic adaptor subunit [Steroidobacteraceae bacterium]|nr:efflux RND transporter periplasmic adaptor subunit [Steroidobacteraceae bacterium]